MGLREAIGRRPKLVAITAICAMAVAGWVIAMQAKDAMGVYSVNDGYFSDDDGVSYFVTDRRTLTPFDRNGKPAVRAYVHTCGDKTFVAYLERYTTEAKAALEDFTQARKSGQQPKNLGAVMSADSNGKEVKRPGDKKWVNITLPAARDIMGATCPDGTAPRVREPW